MGTRRKLIFLAAALLTLASAAVVVRTARGAAGPVGQLTWYGHSCFLLESAGGARIVLDPLSAGLGYALPSGLTADAVTISHEHSDHNNVSLLTNKPRILRGLTADKKGWMRVSEKVKDVTIRSVGVYHDDAKGTQRGLNTVFVFDVGGVRIAHMGDLGHVLTDQQLSDIGSVDVVMIPVGGFFTVDAHAATRVVDQLRPRLIVIPMHHKTDVTTTKELAAAEAFLSGRPNVRRLSSNTVPITALKTRPSAEVILLNHKP